MRRAFVVVVIYTLTLLAGATVGRVSTFSASATLAQDRGNPAVRVWVDTAAGYYHCPNTNWYGKTKQGVYMTQREAQDRNFRPANGVCR